MESIILASGSLQRQKYFKLLGLPFNAASADIDESLCTHTDPTMLTRELAKLKTEKLINKMKQKPLWIFGADTVIAINEKIFGKAKIREDAGAILKELSGKQHNVITSMALYNVRKEKTDIRTSCSTVTFAHLSEAEIEWYLDTNEWQGAAGAYRIQGLGGCFIQKIEGCPSNVVGLPLNEFYAMLKDNGYPFGAS
ncbi:MAG: Maf family protein [Treponema sp.]|jgi:septum formation protein|nr:Maf family protein [Treponema sp.]